MESIPHRPRLLLVDGHSILFSWDELRSLHQSNQTLARETLIQKLTHFQDCSGEHVVLVFDGKGNRSSSSRTNPNALQVIYSASGQTADDIIERITASHAEKYEITVATADGSERETVMAFGGFCISPISLLERIDRANSQLEATLQRLRSNKQRRPF